MTGADQDSLFLDEVHRALDEAPDMPNIAPDYVNALISRCSGLPARAAPAHAFRDWAGLGCP